LNGGIFYARCLTGARAYNHLRRRALIPNVFIEVLMPLWEQGTRALARRMPKVISPTTHAAADYAVAGIFFLGAAWLWKRNRRAAVGSLLCGGAKVANALLTNYPGGAVAAISYRTHGSLDASIAGITASTPMLMGFSDQPEARLFSIQALTETVVSGMTDYGYYEGDGE
jgi:hypothetical protein